MNEQQTLELIVPHRLTANSVRELQQANARILSGIDRYRGNPPSRREACEIAIRIEN